MWVCVVCREQPRVPQPGLEEHGGAHVGPHRQLCAGRLHLPAHPGAAAPQRSCLHWDSLHCFQGIHLLLSTVTLLGRSSGLVEAMQSSANLCYLVLKFRHPAQRMGCMCPCMEIFTICPAKVWVMLAAVSDSLGANLQAPVKNISAPAPTDDWQQYRPEDFDPDPATPATGSGPDADLHAALLASMADVPPLGPATGMPQTFFPQPQEFATNVHVLVSNSALCVEFNPLALLCRL